MVAFLAFCAGRCSVDDQPVTPSTNAAFLTSETAGQGVDSDPFSEPLKEQPKAVQTAEQTSNEAENAAESLPSANSNAAATNADTTVILPQPKRKPEPAKLAEPVADEPIYIRNCSHARALGLAPVRSGDPGYSRKLDRDGDGVGCE